jgi:energy-coupling factor transport system ATP-binding protein
LIGSVFQDPRSQFYTTTTTDEVAFGCENLAIGTEQVRERTDALFDEPQLTQLKDRSIFKISSGEKQKIAIASIRAMQPDIYVFDEPSANLDMVAIGELKATMLALKAEGKTIIISEHRLYYLMDMIDRLIVIGNGAVAADFTDGEWMNIPEKLRWREPLRTFDLSDFSETLPIASCDIQEETSVAATAEDFNIIRKHFTLSADTLRIGYAGKPLIQNISFQAKSGEVIGVTGKNGIGKTTFARTLCGLIKQISGTICIDGEKIKQRKRRSLFSFVMQDPDYQLFAESALDELKIGQKETEWINLKAMGILTNLGLSDYADTHPMALSAGQKQRLTIGACIMKDSKAIIMDEPTSGLDGKNMNRLSRLTSELAHQDKIIFLISHDYEFLAQTCTRILNFADGGDTDDFPLTPEALPKLLRLLSGGDFS